MTGDIATCMYDTGIDSFTGEGVFVARALRDPGRPTRGGHDLAVPRGWLSGNFRRVAGRGRRVRRGPRILRPRAGPALRGRGGLRRAPPAFVARRASPPPPSAGGRRDTRPGRGGPKTRAGRRASAA